MGNSIVVVYWTATEKDDAHKLQLAQQINEYGIKPADETCATLRLSQLALQGIDPSKHTQHVAYEIGGSHVLWHGGTASSLKKLQTLGDTMSAYLREQGVDEVKTCVFHYPL